MKKVFVFCIGGTGLRVMKSITMLMAAGMDTHGYMIVPIIIDPHLDLNEKKNLQSLIESYIEIRKSTEEEGSYSNHFFGSEMEWISKLEDQNNDTNKNASEDRSFAEFLNVGSLGSTSINNLLIKTLYSTESLNNKLSVGFRGNPNVGTVVLQQMLDGASWYNVLKSQCGQDDRVFIISSIFGGTGASGYPLIERKIRNAIDSQTLQDVFMGAVTVLPYYGLTDPKKNNSKIDSGNFMTKAKAALAYYENTVKSDMLYYVGEKELQVYHENNEQTQPDDANFIELVAATALFHFLSQDAKPKEHKFLTRAIANDVPQLDLPSAGTDYAPIAKCIADFEIFKSLLEILRNEKYFTLKKAKGFNEEFYDGSMQKIKDFANSFDAWYQQLSSTKRAFAPVAKINAADMANIIRNDTELEAKNDSYYLLEMIKQSRRMKKSTNNKIRCFLDCTYNAIDHFTNRINKVTE